MDKRCHTHQTKPLHISQDLQKTGGAELRGDWLTSEGALTEPLSRLFPIEREEIEKVTLGKRG